jgi:hypothetical protein
MSDTNPTLSNETETSEYNAHDYVEAARGDTPWNVYAAELCKKWGI